MSGSINEQVWYHMTEETMSGMREWRAQHPKATLRAMGDELDARWARVRARMLEDMALYSAVADWSVTPRGEHPTLKQAGPAALLPALQATIEAQPTNQGIWSPIWAIWRHAWSRCSIRTFGRRAGRLAVASWKAPVSWSWRTG